MARDVRSRHTAGGFFWPEQPRWLGQRLDRAATLDPVQTSTWAYNFILFVLVPLVLLRVAEFSAHNDSTDWNIARRYEFAYPGQLLSLNPIQRLSIRWVTPWPQYKRGKLGWYRQGLREVAQNRRLIESLSQKQEIGIVLAAAIANQGNSYQRPLGWEGLERLQVWVGQHSVCPLPGWAWAQVRWQAYFQQHSVGVAQITPAEVARMGYTLDEIDRFNDADSIRLMQAKLALIRQAALQAHVAPNDAFILMLIGNNNDTGPEIVDDYLRDYSQMERFLASRPADRLQLLKMMTYIDYLHSHANWTKPPDIDWAYLWRMARTVDMP